jgi:UDP-glucose:(heptosyl)LPS alpha-1,3-glucosyltransferase
MTTEAPMRIAVISRLFSKSAGGAESYSVALVEQLAPRHDIHVFAQESTNPVPGVTYHRVFCLSRKPRWVNQILFACLTWIKTRKGFDVVHSHENTWHGQVQTIHVRPLRYNLLHDRQGFKRLLRWLKIALSPRLITYILLEAARFKGTKARKVVMASGSLLGESQQAYPHSKVSMSIVTPGTDMPTHLPSQQQARARLGLPAVDKLILFVANDYARKGLDALLQAMTLLSADVGLLVVGRPGASSKYSQRVQQLGLRSRVHFLGLRELMTDAYCSADCLAHPTLEDSFAMVVLEAMAHGLPVVVSGPAYCGISRQLRDGVEALVLEDPKDAAELAELLTSVLTQPLLAKKLQHHGLAFAEQHLWENCALEYEALYRQVA